MWSFIVWYYRFYDVLSVCLFGVAPIAFVVLNMYFCVWPLFCYVVLRILSSFVIILLRKRKLVVVL